MGYWGHEHYKNWFGVCVQILHIFPSHGSETIHNNTRRRGKRIFEPEITHVLTHWGRVTWFKQWLVAWSALSHWANAGILLIRTSGTNFSEIFNEIHTFSFKKMHLKISSAKWRQFCLGVKGSIARQLWSIQCSLMMVHGIRWLCLNWF